MTELTHSVSGETVTVAVGHGHAFPTPPTGTPLAVDTETTGLDQYAVDFRVRTVQFGHGSRAVVIPIEDEHGQPVPEARAVAAEWLKRAVDSCGLVFHNATFDLLALDRVGLVDLDAALPRTTDTRVMAHLLDPRQPQEGGSGHGLKQLSATYVDSAAPDTQADLVKVFRSYKLTKAVGFAKIPITDETYLLYAGLDVILTSRLFTVLWERIRQSRQVELLRYELQVQRLCARMQQRGFRVDVAYAAGLVDELAEIERDAKAEAASLGVENVSAPRQVAAALCDQGVKLTKTTKTGASSVDSDVLTKLEAKGNPLATAVVRAKRAAKWSTAYVQAMLDLRDENNRVHASINGLQARTARMSISNPPLQQLPARGAEAWKIRRCVVPADGHVLVSADYDQIELRVLAALAGVTRLAEAIHAGEDPHLTTARLVFGDGAMFAYTQWKANEEQAPPEYFEAKTNRTIAKMANFLTVYGGGAGKLSTSAGISLTQAQQFLARFHQAYPEIRRFSKQLERDSYVSDSVTTPKGRRLPVDPIRRYAGLNYLIQSTARDILTDALLRLDEAGMGETLLLPVHDEIIAEVPADQAPVAAKAIGEIMSTELRGIPITAEGTVAGSSWGDRYHAAS